MLFRSTYPAGYAFTCSDLLFHYHFLLSEEKNAGTEIYTDLAGSGRGHGDHDLFSGTDSAVCTFDRYAGQHEWALYHVSGFYYDDIDDVDFDRVQAADED